MQTAFNESSPIGTMLKQVVSDEFYPSEKEKEKKGTFLKGSISKYTQNLVMTFPVICDNTLPAKTASMISKTNEQNVITMLRLLFASIQLNGKDGAELIKSIHTNISMNAAMDDIIDILDDKLSEKIKDKFDNLPFTEASNEFIKQLKENIKTYPTNSFSKLSLNDYAVYNIYGKTIVREDKKKQQTIKEDININNLNVGGGKNNNNNAFDPLKYTAQLLDNDVKKMNETSPALLVVKYNEIDSEGKIITRDAFITGVKSRLIATESSDIIERLIAKNKTKLSFLNLIRATTGEISFIKDFILCTKQAKIDAKNSVKKGYAAKMWKVLEYRAAKNNRNKIRNIGNDASAITTLVLNQETVNILKKEYDFDLEKLSNTKMIMDAYNLLGIIICDESIEVAKVFYDGNESYEQQAYSFIQKDAKDNSKQLINLINKMGR